MPRRDGPTRSLFRKDKHCEIYVTYHAEGVVQVSQSIDEARISLLDEVVEREDRLQLVPSPRLLELVASCSSSNLLHEAFELSKLMQQRLVHDVGDVFDVVVDLVIALETFRWNSRIDALQDAESAKVFQCNL